tara:strand:+ start:16268 stop:16516 length:249 start_codon:yes stop_codon:yes gene_type:complete
MKYFLIFLALFIINCKGEVDKKNDVVASEIKKTEKISFQTPDELLGDLFPQVQLNQVFADGKTFVDCIAKYPYKDIKAKYET